MQQKEDLLELDLLEIQPVRLPAEAWRDQKKLTKFLTDVEFTLNKIIAGVKEQTRITANELVQRPTYAELF
jgi:hypothetical protein